MLVKFNIDNTVAYNMHCVIGVGMDIKYLKLEQNNIFYNTK